MKIILLLSTLMIAGTAIAAETGTPSEEARYVSLLCTTASAQPDASRDAYLQQLNDMHMRSHSSSSLNKTDFDSEVAGKVVDGWLALSPEQRRQAHTQAGCEKALGEQLKAAD